MKPYVMLFEEYTEQNVNPYVQPEARIDAPKSGPTIWDPKNINLDYDTLQQYLHKYPMIIAKEREDVIFTDLTDGPFVAIITGVEKDETGRCTGLKLKVVDNISSMAGQDIDFWEIHPDEKTLYDTGIEAFVKSEDED